MIPRLLFAALLLALPAGAGLAAPPDDPAGDLRAWGDSLDLDARILRELDRYAADEGDWPEDSARRFAEILRRRLVAESAKALAALLAGEREPYVAVDYLDDDDFEAAGEEFEHKRQRAFASGLIRTEQLAFFPGAALAPDSALARFVDPAFRMQTSSRIERIWTEDGLSCIETKGLWGLLDPTQACNRIDELHHPAFAAEHSQVVANPGDDDTQTVYFKESLKAFVLLPEGLALVYLNYTRSAKLSALKKKLGRGRIVASQEDRAAAFGRLLALGTVAGD
jgi:hypothetical protein